MQTLIKALYNVNFKITVRRGYNYNKNYIYILETKENVATPKIISIANTIIAIRITQKYERAKFLLLIFLNHLNLLHIMLEKIIQIL